MTDSAESEARRALNRLRHAAEKALRELDSLEGALAHAEGADFPRAAYDELRARLGELMDFTEEESRRLQDKVLQAGGLEPGRVRRTGG
jgi:Cdc6-like AAA superfamily ATPase